MRYIYPIALALFLAFGSATFLAASATYVAAQEKVTAPDFDGWERIAARAEKQVADPNSDDALLARTREELVEWRSIFQAAISANEGRITTLREQISALGPPPEEGATEAAEIAHRRRELNEQLSKLEAPALAADEAFRLAEGLIRDIDRVARDRKAKQLLTLWPMPINPANWPAALTRLGETGVSIWDELHHAWTNEALRAELVHKIPVISIYLLIALIALHRGRQWIERLTLRLQQSASEKGRQLLELMISVGQVLVPLLGVLALREALLATGLFGLVGSAAISVLPAMGLTFFGARWLGRRMFPRSDQLASPLRLVRERRSEGRLLASLAGVVVAVDYLRVALIHADNSDTTVLSVLSFPLIAAGGLILYRMGRLILAQSAAETAPASPEDAEHEPVAFGDRLIGLIGRFLIVVGVVGPVVSAVGYVPAGTAIVYPTMLSLGFLAFLRIVQGLVSSAYALIIPSPEDGRDALLPVVFGFVLSILALPVFALIWGANEGDLRETWTRFTEGFTFGTTHISPSNFLTFAIVFAIGYLVTRLLQGALRSSILPRTTIDQGGKNAILAGIGYSGIFFAVLIAVTAAGIDLSSLAIVAGALSLGIGFGLQNIVSNFVSGIILLIERPISEGDWIEVNGVHGTVKGISVRSTRIQTFDRTDVIVPNSNLVSGMVTNWTRFNLTGRLIVPVGVAYGTDTRKVEAILGEVAAAQPLVVLDPPPVVFFIGFGADSLNFEVRVILRDVNFKNAVLSEINHEIARRFAEEKIEIPFAQRDLWIRNPEALIPREKTRRKAAKPLSASDISEADLPGDDAE